MQVKVEAGLPERTFRPLITVGLRFLLPKQQIHVEIYISLKKHLQIQMQTFVCFSALEAGSVKAAETGASNWFVD